MVCRLRTSNAGFDAGGIPRSERRISFDRPDRNFDAKRNPLTRKGRTHELHAHPSVRGTGRKASSQDRTGASMKTGDKETASPSRHCTTNPQNMPGALLPAAPSSYARARSPRFSWVATDRGGDSACSVNRRGRARSPGEGEARPAHASGEIGSPTKKRCPGSRAGTPLFASEEASSKLRSRTT